MRHIYTSIVFQHDVEKDGPAEDFSIVAVKDGVAFAHISKIFNTEQGLPQVAFPDFNRFVSMFDDDVVLIKHAPVRDGTEWDGEKFLVPDDSEFEVIGVIETENS
jgi:hypothetical protein